jgi:hypothetical protein
MATEKWIAGSGQGLTWGDAFTGSTLNSLANVSSLLSDIAITNGTALDLFADISFALGSAAFTAPAYIMFGLYPLNKDGTTYGDGRFGSAVAAVFPSNYLAGSAGLVAATQAQTGSITGILLPPGTFKFIVFNGGNIAWASSGNTIQYRTYNRQIT